MLETIPSISLTKLETSEDERKKLHFGLTDVGFLYLCDHGVSRQLVEDLHALTQEQIFKADCKERQRLCQWKNGLLSYGDIYNKNDTKILNFKSSKKLNLYHIDKVFNKYIEEMKAVGQKLVYWIEKVLGLYSGRLTQAYGTDPVIIQHANRYKAVNRKRWAFVEHVDSSIMTMLMQNGKDGLEVDWHGKWVPVPFRENTFVVNLGNMLEHVTYGILKATWHRVRLEKNIERFSWPTFFTMSPNSNLIQVKEFEFNKKNYLERIVAERSRILGLNQDRQEEIDADENVVEWLKGHSKRMDEEAANGEFPKVDSQMMEMCQRKQIEQMGYDITLNQARDLNYSDHF